MRPLELDFDCCVPHFVVGCDGASPPTDIASRRMKPVSALRGLF
jgi:hypothetical protein